MSITNRNKHFIIAADTPNTVSLTLEIDNDYYSLNLLNPTQALNKVRQEKYRGYQLTWFGKSYIIGKTIPIVKPSNFKVKKDDQDIKYMVI